MELFTTFEKTGMKIDDDWHLFVLHYLFLPRIEEELDEFKNAWNNHPVTTERNETPLQMLVLRDGNYPPEVIDEEEYGVDDDNDNDDGEDYRVPCKPVFCPLSEANYTIFVNNIKPLNLDTPPYELKGWFYDAIEYISVLRNNQK